MSELAKLFVVVARSQPKANATGGSMFEENRKEMFLTNGITNANKKNKKKIKNWCWNS